MIIHPTYLQRKARCKVCSWILPRGSRAIKVGVKKGLWYSWWYNHLECFNIQVYFQHWFNTHEFKNKLGRKKNPSPPVIGKKYKRPVQTTVREEVRRIRALIRYHRKKGNVERIRQLEEEVETHKSM